MIALDPSIVKGPTEKEEEKLRSSIEFFFPLKNNYVVKR
jgi:hypothetical protein